MFLSVVVAQQTHKFKSTFIHPNREYAFRNAQVQVKHHCAKKWVHIARRHTVSHARIHIHIHARLTSEKTSYTNSRWILFNFYLSFWFMNSVNPNTINAEYPSTECWIIITNACACINSFTRRKCHAIFWLFSLWNFKLQNLYPNNHIVQNVRPSCFCHLPPSTRSTSSYKTNQQANSKRIGSVLCMRS